MERESKADRCQIIDGLCGSGLVLSKIDLEYLLLSQFMTEAERLREENARLRGLLIQHGIEIPDPPSKDGIPSTTVVDRCATLNPL
jgi:hypothetical protein